MNQAAHITMYVSPLEQFTYFLAHQPPVLSIVLAYAVACLILFWITRGKGFLIAMGSGAFYLCPMIMHLASS